MRKLHKNMLLELIKALGRATSEAKKLYTKNDTQTLTNYLTDFQDSAIRIGNLIEQYEGEGHITVSYLEEYCELLYHASLELSDPDGNGNIIKKLIKQLIKIENSVKNDIKIRLEIVFMPYKASMFDSLESIWLAAKDDPECDVYVVPIPYFDRNPDGTFGQMYYEGDQYPDYVPVVDWRKYNVEEHRPDVIYIHNAYDENNYVTSVHPDYYARRLYKFTDMLVYVPYFVNGEDAPEHFCVLQGTPYVSKVIVQSEKIRQTYIRAYKEFERNSNCIGSFGKAEDKFIALGSPKIDKVINSKREDFDIPDEWNKLIEKPDRTRRKTVLYNTSVGPMVRGDKHYIMKLRLVLNTFKENGDVVLWWRPHPLSKSAYSSMRPQLLREYLSIVEEYKRQGYGIYDDSSDLHRAIACTDAYYGDTSSLIVLYLCSGKPLMRQNTYISYDNQCSDVYYDDDENIWFIHRGLLILFKLQKITFGIKHMGTLPCEINCQHPYSGIVENDGKLFFIPCEARETGVYNLKTKHFEKVSGPIDKIENIKDRQNFGDIIDITDKNKFFNKVDIIEKMIDCVFYEFSFADLSHFLNYLFSGHYNESKEQLQNKQLDITKHITENADGTSGIKIHEYTKSII